MDLSFSAEQDALRGLAREIFSARCSDDRLRAVEAGEGRFDADLWSELGRANLLGVGVPEEHGGIGGGILEAAIVLEEAGRATAPVPLWASLTAALALTRGDAADLLDAYAAGGPPVVPALTEPDAGDPYAVTTAATAGRLTGTKSFVHHAEQAAALLIPARDGDTAALFMVSPADTALARQEPTGSAPTSEVALAEAPATPVAGAPDRLVDDAIVLACAHQLGVAERALELTAAYTSERVQFDKPIATFQAVQQRAADAYIDVQAMRWTMWEAAWRLSEGLDAREHVAVAKVWSAHGSARVIEAAQHLHGGIGVDVDYPLHRSTFAARQGELLLGGAGPHLQRIGDALA